MHVLRLRKIGGYPDGCAVRRLRWRLLRDEGTTGIYALPDAQDADLTFLEAQPRAVVLRRAVSAEALEARDLVLRVRAMKTNPDDARAAAATLSARFSTERARLP